MGNIIKCRLTEHLLLAEEKHRVWAPVWKPSQTNCFELQGTKKGSEVIQS